jgi:pyridoxine kinase
MQDFIPRAAAIHDLSSVGRCSLSVILPVLSVLKVQVCPIPTAVLSTHTGGFGDVSFNDLTGFISESLLHFKRIGINFDCVYSGFLGNEHQIDSVMEFLMSYPKALKVVDPVMGDNGKSYRTCTPALQKGMSKLVSKADIITPNLTEAYMLLNKEYSSLPLDRNDARSMLLKLSEKGPDTVVITSVPITSFGMSNIGFNRSR